MSENNYGALMMKSTVGASDDINAILSPGIYPIPPANTSSPDSAGGVLLIHAGTPIRRTFISDSTICLTSTRNGNAWSAWKGPLSRTNPFADIKADGATAVAMALLNLGLGEAAKQGVATNADMQTGTATDLLATVAAVMSIFSKRSFTQNDFIRIPDVPGGLIIQWGMLTGVSGSNVITSTLTFPELFPNACLAVVPIALSGAINGGMCGIQVKTKTRSNADIFIYERDSGAIGPHDVPYIAFGE